MAEKVQVILDGKDTSGTAFQSFQANIAKAQAAIAGFAGGIAGGVVAQLPQILEAAFEHVNPKSVIDAADQLNKLSQRTGLAVETLGALEFAGKLADVSTDELATSLKRLNVNIAAAARGEKEQAGAFAAIGVSVKDANGNIRDAGEILGDVADKFSGYEDGANKVAIANALGGKSFEKLIPLLNGGRQGFADAKAELEKLGAAIGPELARKSEIFNDNLTRIATAGTAVKVTIAGGLIDTLVDLSDKQVAAVKSGTLLADTFDRIKSVLFGGPGLIKDYVFGKSLPPDKLADSQKAVADLSVELAKLQDYLSRNPNSSGTQKAVDAIISKLATARQSLKDAQDAATADFRRNDKKGSDFSAAPPPKKAAPALPNTSAADNAEALLKKQLEGRIKAIRDAFENEKDLFAFGQRQLDEEYQHGEVSIEDYYAAKSKAADDFLARQQKALSDEIAAQRETQAKFTKPQDRQDAENKIADLLAQQAKGYREAGQAAEVAGKQEQRAFEDVARTLLSLDAELAELSGDKLGADLARNALKIEEVQKQLAKVGGDPARLASLRELLANQAQFAKVQDDVARITDRAQTAEEAFLLTADRGGKSLLETEGGVRDIRTETIRQLDKEIAKTAELLKTQQSPDLIDYYEKLKVTREKAFEAQDPGLKRYRDALEEMGQVGANSLEDLIVDGGKVSDVFKAMEKDLIRLITHDFLTAPLATSLSNWLKDLSGTGGQKSGGLGGGDLFSGIASLLGFGGTGGYNLAGTGSGAATGFTGAVNFHSGGFAGSSRAERQVPATVFDHAERYHSGGLAGLMHDEVPAILRKREEVLRTDDPRHRDNWSAGASRAPVTQILNFQMNSQPSRETQAEIARRAGIAIAQAMQRNN